MIGVTTFISTGTVLWRYLCTTRLKRLWITINGRLEISKRMLVVSVGRVVIFELARS